MIINIGRSPYRGHKDYLITVMGLCGTSINFMADRGMTEGCLITEANQE